MSRWHRFQRQIFLIPSFPSKLYVEVVYKEAKNGEKRCVKTADTEVGDGTTSSVVYRIQKTYLMTCAPRISEKNFIF